MAAGLTMRRLTHTSLVALLSLIAFAGCGGTETSVTETVTVVETNEPAAPPSQTVTVVETESAPIEAAAPPAEEQAERIAVPDVVGLDHQLAQDTMQAAGLYILAEEDATGAGRMLLWDRNWTVVAQDPPSGTMVDENTTITLRSKKDDE
jgi:hypothetical protein